MTKISALPQISVLLPVYNGARYLEQAVASILSQDADLELIVCDDGSQDGSSGIVARIPDQRIRLLANPRNLGIFGNLNRCIGEARGGIIQVFSQDDVMLPGYLHSQAGLLARYPQAGLVYGTPDYIDAAGIRIASGESDTTPELISRELYLWLSAHYGSLPPSISSVTIPRRTFDEVGLYNPRFRVAGDLDFYNRVGERYPLLRNSERLHLIRSHPAMTSALSSAGPLYLEEELELRNWYQGRMSAEDYRKVQRYRAATRGRYHMGWIRRLAFSGHAIAAAAGLWRLSRLCPLRLVFAALLWKGQAHVPLLPVPTSGSAVSGTTAA